MIARASVLLGLCACAARPAPRIAARPVDKLTMVTWTVDAEPWWSPDGKHIVLVSSRHGGMKIHVIDADGSDHGNAMTQLTFGAAEDDTPAWSPDGAHIAYVSVQGGHSQIWVMNADGGAPHAVTTGIAENIHPAWTPDGARGQIDTTPLAARVASAADNTRPIGDASDDAMDLATVRWDGTDLRRLTTSGRTTYASYSPDGRFIVHRHAAATGSKIFVMNADGTGDHDVSGDSILDGWPSWSPDGARIVFTRKVGDDFEIFVMDRDGGAVRQLTFGPGRFVNARWSPDGRAILCGRGLGDMTLMTFAAPAP